MVSYFGATERGLAQSIERRSPQAGFLNNVLHARQAQSASTSTSAASQTVVAPSPSPSRLPFVPPPDSVKALAGAIAVIGAIVLALIMWRIVVWRRKKARKANPKVLLRSPSASSMSTESVSDKSISEKDSQGYIAYFDLEKGYTRYPAAAFVAPAVPLTPDMQVGWTPQIRALGTTNANPQLPAPAVTPKKRKSRSSKFKSRLSALAVRQNSPPPSYEADAQINASLDNDSMRQFAKRNTPNGPRALPSPKLQPSIPVPPPPVPPIPQSLKVDTSTDAAVSPISPNRTDSVSLSTLGLPASSNALRSPRSPNSSSKLPRLVNVISTFAPTLPDELSVKTGDVLRLLEEFEDGWCAVQRMGRHDAEKGVVPRFCVEDRLAAASASIKKSFYLSVSTALIPRSR